MWYPWSMIEQMYSEVSICRNIIAAKFADGSVMVAMVHVINALSETPMYFMSDDHTCEIIADASAPVVV